MSDRAERYKVVVAPEAWVQIHEHRDFLAVINERAADALAEDFVKAARTLEVSPELYSWLIDENVPERKYRKLLFSKNHMALYEVFGERRTVLIAAVVDCRSDYSWLLY